MAPYAQAACLIFNSLPEKYMFWILVAIGVGIAALLAHAAALPNNFRVHRSININAHPEEIFPLINDFCQWESWWPWEKNDPGSSRVYSGAAAGKGAACEWRGNKNSGRGRMEITESSPSSRLVLKLDFIKPIAARHVVKFTLLAHGDSTTVTQAMEGKSPYLSRLRGIFFNNGNKIIGDNYEQGLANLKAIIEK
jgi:hypothetical protein